MMNSGELAEQRGIEPLAPHCETAICSFR